MKVDVHQHFAPAAYLRGIEMLSTLRHGTTNLRAWSIDTNLRSLDGNRIDYGIASISAPGVWFGNEANAAELTRIWNDEADRLCEVGGGRFGFFAALPLPSVEGSLAEIARIARSKHVKGFSAFTNYDHVWLGDERYTPIYEVLDDLEASLFVHPTTSMAEQTLPDWRPQIIEFPFDTTRAAASLIRAKVQARFARMRMILAHGGGCLAYLASRMDALDEASSPAGAYSTGLRQFYYDSALVSDANIDHLLGLTTADHILFGSDAPFCHHLEPAHAQRFAENVRPLMERRATG